MARKPKAGDKVLVRDGSGEPREYTLGPEINLETEVILDSQGRRIDDAYADRLVAEVLAARSGPGRPSLSGPGEVSPTVQFRVTPALRAKLEFRARAEGKRVSDVAREALERYIG